MQDNARRDTVTDKGRTYTESMRTSDSMNVQDDDSPWPTRVLEFIVVGIIVLALAAGVMRRAAHASLAPPTVAVPVSSVFIVPQSAQRIDYLGAPPHPYVLRATVPVTPGSPPLRVAGATFSDYRVVAHSRDHDVAEVAALVPGVPPDASSASGAVSYSLVPATPAAPISAGLPPLLRHARDLLVLEVDGVPYPLTSTVHFRGLYRRGRALATARFHAPVGLAVPSASPATTGGPTTTTLGHVETWVTARADALQLDVVLLWHRAVPGPDAVFGQARLLTPPGTGWVPALREPAVRPPHLVLPAPVGQNVVPQQMGRPFWLSVVPLDAAGQPATPEPEHVGVADWTGGGYLPSGFAVPELGSPPGATGLAADLADARWRLQAGLPELDHEPPPAARLWPASGEYGGGAGGGTGRYPLDGVRWAASRGDPAGLELARIGLLRGLSRARFRLGPDGGPLDLDAAAAPYGPQGAPWSFWTDFLGGHDQPWGWGAWAPRWVAQDPRIYSDLDFSDLFRRARHAWVLSWLDNDPVARLVSLELGTRARLTFWEGPGRAHRLDALPAAPGTGTDWGLWQGAAALAVAQARALGADEYSAWVVAFRGHLAAAQMLSGELVNRQGGYPSDLSPFFGVYRLAGAADSAYLGLALYSLGDDGEVLDGLARAMANLGTPDDGRAGLYYYWPTSTVDPNFPPFETRADWPAWTAALMGVTGHEGYLTAWDQGYLAAAFLRVGAPDAATFADRFATTAEMRGWGLVAPDSRTRAPVEQWWPLLGVGR